MNGSSLVNRYFLAIGLLLTGVAPASAIAVPGIPAPVATETGMTRVQYYYPPPPGYYAPAPHYYAPAPAPVPYSPPSERDLNRAYDPTRDGPLGVPTQRGAVPYSYMCYAGNYTCQLPAAGPVGSGCACPGLGAPSYGSIR